MGSEDETQTVGGDLDRLTAELFFGAQNLHPRETRRYDGRGDRKLVGRALL